MKAIPTKAGTTICPPYGSSTEWGGQCAGMCTQLVASMVTN